MCDPIDLQQRLVLASAASRFVGKNVLAQVHTEHVG